MRRRVAALLVAVSAAACSRDMAVPPPPSAERLGILPVFQSAAPRQPVQFVGAGGAGGYTFAFAQGGQLSGADAAIDPDGLYTAGSTGSAQDVIEVTDSAGTKATATVSVGQRLAVTPSFTGTSPGGRITFDASGGKTPYAFGFVQNTSSGNITLDGHYEAGSIGDVVDTLLVTDVYGATANAAVQVGSALQLYRSETRPVAPHESVTFIAFGGQPPYAFSIAAGSSRTPTIDATSGVYTAGDRSDPDPDGIVTDVVRVTDSAAIPQVATIVVPVGARLALTLNAVDIHPGQTAQLLASGGKPPYTFGFAARVPPANDVLRQNGGNGGNRSHGTVNAFTGDYVPGFSPGAVDWFQVTDATGAPAALREGPPVGGVPFAIGHGVRRCVVGDFNGDRSQDVAFQMNSDQISRVVTAESIDTAEPFLQSYFVQQDALAASVVADVSRTGRDWILAFGGDRRCDSDCYSSDMFAYVPDLAGYLSIRQVVGGGSSQFETVLNDPEYQPTVGAGYTHQVALNYGIRAVAEILDAGASTWRFYTDGQDPSTIQTTTSPSGVPRCAGTSGPADRPLLRFDWLIGDATPSAPACVTATGFCPTCVSSVCGTCTSGTCWGCEDPNCTVCSVQGVYLSPIAFAVGDFNGDGRTDLAWILETVQNRRIAGGGTAKIYVSYGAGPIGPGATVSFPAPVSDWPGPTWSFETDRQQDQSRFVVVHPPPGTTGPDALLIRMVDAGRPKLVIAVPQSAGTPWIWTQILDPNPVGGAVAGVVPYTPAPGSPTSFLAWSAGDGQLTGFGLDPSYAFTGTKPLATMPFAVDAVCTPDVNGDGIPDLVAASDNAATAQLVVGDAGATGSATGAFGVRAHLRGLNFPVGVADLDADGFGDVVAADETGGLSVLWGGGGMLAWGPRIVSAPVSGVVVGDYFGDGQPSVLYQQRTGGFGKLHNLGDGTFDPAAALTGVAATGGPAVSSFFMWYGALGTSAPGGDAFAIGGGGSFQALLVQDAAVVEVTPKDIPPFDATYTRTRDCWPIPIGVNQPAVVLGCTFEPDMGSSNVLALFGATISNPDGAAGSGSPPTFSDWVVLTSTVIGSDEFTMPPPAGATARIGQIGQRPDAPGTALFMMATDQLYAVEVSAAPGNELLPETWNVQTFAVTPTTVGAIPFLGTTGRLDADPTSQFHAVVGGASGITVVRRNAAAVPGSEYELVQRLEGSAFPLGIAPLSTIAPGVKSPGDAILFFGDFSGLGVNSELVPYLNDGTGRLR